MLQRSRFATREDLVQHLDHLVRDLCSAAAKLLHSAALGAWLCVLWRFLPRRCLEMISSEMMICTNGRALFIITNGGSILLSWGVGGNGTTAVRAELPAPEVDARTEPRLDGRPVLR